MTSRSLPLTRADRRARTPGRVHNRRVQSQTIDLIERVRHRLREVDQPCVVAGPASEEAVASAEEQLGIAFPPSYRAFLRRFGGLALPAQLAVIHDFLGIAPGASDRDVDNVVSRTLAAREAHQLSPGLVVVGIGAQANEWFCLDAATRPLHYRGGLLAALSLLATEPSSEKRVRADLVSLHDQLIMTAGGKLDDPMLAELRSTLQDAIDQLTDNS